MTARLLSFCAACIFLFAHSTTIFAQIDFSPLSAPGFGKAPKQSSIEIIRESSGSVPERVAAPKPPSARAEIRQMNDLRANAQTRLSANLAPVAPGVSATNPGGWITSAAAPNPLFGTARGPSLAFFVPTGHTYGTEVSFEQVQRAVAIMALRPNSDEDAAFLATQAAVALQGGELRVNIVSLPSQFVPATEAREAVRLAEESFKLRNDLNSAHIARRQIEQQYNTLKKANRSGVTPHSEYMRKLNDIRPVLATRAEAEEKAKSKLKNAIEKWNSYSRSWIEQTR